jgi:mannose-6-phosphate isomerase
MNPIKTKPFFCEKDWGGEKLRTLFGKEIPGSRTGESWEISAHENGQSSVEGVPLATAVERYGRELLGETQAPFPLLIKLLDARENLSVQVHPDDALALELEGQPYGKTEAWVVLDAPEGAQLILGVDCTPTQFVVEAEAGLLDRHLLRVPVKEGDAFFIPAGTVHALTAGVVVYEVQQSSDTTYRLYAWGRDAELHIEKAARAMALPAEGAGLTVPKRIAPNVTRLVTSHAFTLDRVDAKGGLPVTPDGRRFACLTALSPGFIAWEGGGFDYARGDSILVPASSPPYALRGGELLCALPTLPGEA